VPRRLEAGLHFEVDDGQIGPANQIIKVFDLKTGQSNQDNFLPFLQGMKAQAQARYELTLVKEDKLYTYIKIVPRLLEDKSGFSRGPPGPLEPTLLPRELRFVAPTATKISGTFPRSNPTAPAQSHRFHGPQAAGPAGNGKRPGAANSNATQRRAAPRLPAESVARESRKHERRSLEK